MTTSSSTAGIESPAEAFNRAMGMERIRNPYPGWAEMRRQGPLHRIDLSQVTPPYLRPGEDPSGFMVVGVFLLRRHNPTCTRVPHAIRIRRADMLVIVVGFESVKHRGLGTPSTASPISNA